MIDRFDLSDKFGGDGIVHTPSGCSRGGDIVTLLGIHTAVVFLWRLHHCSHPAVRTIRPMGLNQPKQLWYGNIARNNYWGLVNAPNVSLG